LLPITPLPYDRGEHIISKLNHFNYEGKRKGKMMSMLAINTKIQPVFLISTYSL